MAKSSLVSSVAWELLHAALKLDPDFSEWRDKPQKEDIDFGPAPEIAGCYLAAKKALLREKRSRELSQAKEKRLILSMTLLVALAELEFMEVIASSEQREYLRMRSTGRIVLVRNVNDK